MRSALRGTEVIPPADGWARLERELGPHPRISVLRSHWPRIAAAAAAVLVFLGAIPKKKPSKVFMNTVRVVGAVLIFLGGGGYLLHENRDLGDKGFVIATATDSGSSAADMAQVDGTPAGDGEGTLAGALRAAVPTEEAVRAAALPGEEPGAGTAPGIAPGRSAFAAADMRGFEDGRAAALTSGAAPAGEAVAANAVTGNSVAENAVAGSEASGKASAAAAAHRGAAAGHQIGTRPAVRAAVAGQASATDGNPGEEAAGQAVQPRKYPGTYDYLADGVQEYRRPRRKTSVSLFAAGGVTGSSGASGGVGPNLVMSDIFVGGTNGTMAQLKYNYEDYSFRHHQPLSFGLSVRKEFAYGLSLESGVNYTLLWSDVSMQSGGEDISQKLHFIGVPLRLNWQFLETGRFSMYVGAGGMLEKCVSAKFGSKSVDEPKVQWSVAGAVGAQYRLGNYVGLYFEPEVSHYFTETTLRTSRTDSSLSLTLRLGVRLSF